MDAVYFGSTLAWSPPASGPIVSIQQVTIVIGASSTSNTGSISGIGTLANCSIHLDGFSSDTNPGQLSEVRARVALTDATTVTATRGAADTNAVTVIATVIEWHADWIQSIQHGVITIPSNDADNTATISSVNTSNSAAIFLGDNSFTTNNSYNVAGCSVVLTNGTTVTATHGTNASSNTADCGFCVIEWKAAKMAQAVQKVNIQIAAAAATNTATITAVAANAVTFFGGTYSTGNPSQGYGYIRRNSTTQLTAERNSALTLDVVNVLATVVDFTSDTINARTAAQPALGAATAAVNSTFSAFVEAKTWVSWLGTIGDNEAFAINPSDLSVRAAIVSTTQVTSTRGTTTRAVKESIECIEFK